MEYPTFHCAFPLVRSPENYLDGARIRRIWRGLLNLNPEFPITMHVCPLQFMNDGEMTGSFFFLEKGTSVVPISEDDLPAPHGNRVHLYWEGQTPNPAPHLTLSTKIVPDPESSCCKLSDAIGEELTWSTPPMGSRLDDSNTLVFLPVETDFVLTPEKAALAWEWLESFLDNMRDEPTPYADAGYVDIQGERYRVEHREKPGHYKIERLMSLYPEPEVFYGPQGSILCPECGQEPDVDAVLEAVGELSRAHSPHMRFASPCCGKVFSFNQYDCGWLKFGRFALQTAFTQSTEEALAELSSLMGAPFTSMHTHI